RTVQPRCVHTAENARTVDGSGLATNAGTRSIVTAATPPTGTSSRAMTSVPEDPVSEDPVPDDVGSLDPLFAHPTTTDPAPASTPARSIARRLTPVRPLTPAPPLTPVRPLTPASPLSPAMNPSHLSLPCPMPATRVA